MKYIIILLFLFLLMGCQEVEKEVDSWKEESNLANDVLQHEEYIEGLQGQLKMADCKPWALFPKGNSVNTLEGDGVVVFKCYIHGVDCYYIEPNGRLGPSLSCMKEEII